MKAAAFAPSRALRRCGIAVGLAASGCAKSGDSASISDPVAATSDSAPDANGADGTAPSSTPDSAAWAADPTDASTSDAPASYLAAESVIRTSCAFVRCHGGPTRGGAGLWFGPGSIRGPLVNVSACEDPDMMRVRPGDPSNSWVRIKLEAPQDPETHAIEFSPPADWVPDPACGPGLDPTDASGRFGLRMPATGTFQLDGDGLAKLVSWIEAGAPGPD